MHIIRDTFLQYHYDTHLDGYPEEPENSLLDSTYKKKILKDVREAYQSMTRAWDNAGKKIKENNKSSYWDE